MIKKHKAYKKLYKFLSYFNSVRLCYNKEKTELPFNLRYIKKKIKKASKYCCDDSLINGQKLWCYLGIRNPRYRDFLIKKMIEADNKLECPNGGIR